MSASNVFRCEHKMISGSEPEQSSTLVTHLLLVREPDIRGHGRLVITLRFDLLNLRQVHLRKRELLLALVDLAIKVDLALHSQITNRSATSNTSVANSDHSP